MGILPMSFRLPMEGGEVVSHFLLVTTLLGLLRTHDN